MGLSGKLETMPIADLLQFLGMGRKTGMLVVRSGNYERKLWFEEGRLVSSRSDDPQEYLGQFLLQLGIVDEGTLGGALRLADRQKRPLGAVMIAGGLLTEERLKEILVAKCYETIYNLFLWDKGTFEFLDGERIGDEHMRISMEFQGVLMEGAYRVDQWKVIRDVFPADDMIVTRVAGVAIESDEDIEDATKLVYTTCGNQPQTIGALCMNLHRTKFWVYNQLLELKRRGAIRIGQVEPPEPPEFEVRPPTNLTAPADIDSPDVTFVDDPTYAWAANGKDRALTGSATSSLWSGSANLTTHTGTTGGVYDLNGNIWEWTETVGLAQTTGNYIVNDVNLGVAAPGQNYLSALATDSRLRRLGLPGATSGSGTALIGGDGFLKRLLRARQIAARVRREPPPVRGLGARVHLEGSGLRRLRSDRQPARHRGTVHHRGDEPGVQNIGCAEPSIEESLHQRPADCVGLGRVRPTSQIQERLGRGVAALCEIAGALLPDEHDLCFAGGVPVKVGLREVGEVRIVRAA